MKIDSLKAVCFGSRILRFTYVSLQKNVTWPLACLLLSLAGPLDFAQAQSTNNPFADAQKSSNNVSADAPRFTSQPVAKTTKFGSSVRFSVAVAGSPAPKLQWQTSKNGVDWSNLSGQTANVLRLQSLVFSDNSRMFRVQASNRQGKAFSDAAMLTVTAASCSRNDVQAALTAALDGDTVTLPDGDCDWGAAPAVKRSAGIWLKGAGKAVSRIRRTAAVVPLPYNGVPCTTALYYDANNDVQQKSCNGNPPPEKYLIEFDCTNGKRVELSDLSLIGNDDLQTESQRIIDQDSGLALKNSCRDFKVHDAAFTRFSDSGISVQGASRGVVYNSDFIANWKCQDKNTIVPRDDGTNWKIRGPISCLGYGVTVYGDGTWPDEVALGTQDAVFIENNLMLDNRHAIASNNGSKYVVRYNQIDHTERARNFGIIDAHGRGSYGPGSRSWEIYENTLIDNTTTHNNTTGIGIRGGDGVIFNNVVPKQFAWPFALSTETACSAANYPLQNQTRAVYAWGNHAPGLSTLQLPTIAFKISAPDCIKENRELFLTPKDGYKPFTYPHPLRARSFS